MDVIKWLSDHRQLDGIFALVLVGVLGWLVKRFLMRDRGQGDVKVKQTQRAVAKSGGTVQQAGGDIVNVNKPAEPAPLTTVDGHHEAAGIGEVTGLDIEDAAIIKPGTISKAEGIGRVTATRIGQKEKQ